MICKWCGAAIEPRQKCCTNCGREIPPLSDCGGFYDIVPTRRPAAPQPSSAAPQATKPRADVRPAEKPRSETARGRGKHALLLSLAALVLLLALVLLFVWQARALRRELSQLTAKAEEQAARIDELEAALAAQKNAPTVPDTEHGDEPDVPDVPDEPKTPDEPDLDEQTLTYEVTPDGTGWFTVYGEPEGSSRVPARDEREADRVLYIANGESDQPLWWAQLSETSAEHGLHRDKAFTFSYWTDEDRLGEQKSQDFTWYYYSEADGDWILFEPDDSGENVKIEDESSKGESTLTLVVSWLREQLGSEETDGDSISVRLRCTVMRRSRDGGSITLIFDYPEFTIPNREIPNDF